MDAAAGPFGSFVSGHQMPDNPRKTHKHAQSRQKRSMTDKTSFPSFRDHARLFGRAFGCGHLGSSGNAVYAFSPETAEVTRFARHFSGRHLPLASIQPDRPSQSKQAMNLLVRVHGDPNAHSIPFCHGARIRSVPLTDTARPDRASLAGCQRLQRQSKTNSQDKTSTATRTGAAATEPSLARSPYLQPARFSHDAAAAAAASVSASAAASRASATCNGNIGDWVDPAAAAAAGKGRPRATRTSLCNFVATLQPCKLRPCTTTAASLAWALRQASV